MQGGGKEGEETENGMADLPFHNEYVLSDIGSEISDNCLSVRPRNDFQIWIRKSRAKGETFVGTPNIVPGTQTLSGCSIRQEISESREPRRDLSLILAEPKKGD